LKFFKYGGGAGWRRSVKNEEYYTGSRKRGIFYQHSKDGRLTGLVTSCVETAF
jgi:hypothetical protein